MKLKSLTMWIGACAASLLISSGALAAPRQNSAEVRAAYIVPEAQFSPDEKTATQQIADFVAKLQAANFNLLFVYVRSEYFAALTDATYQKTVPKAKFDVVGLFINAALKAGIKVDLTYSVTKYKSKASPEFVTRLGGNPDWAVKRPNQGSIDPKTGKPIVQPWTVVCLSWAAARQFELNLIDKMLQHYKGVSGIQIEEPGYSSNDFCVCTACMQIYKDQFHITGTPDLKSAAAQYVRIIGVTQFLQALRKLMNTKYPGLSLSANGGYDFAAAKTTLGSDWVNWAKAGLIDFYVGQVYQSDLPGFNAHVAQVVNTMGLYCPVVILVGVGWYASKLLPNAKNSPVTITQEISALRTDGVAGEALFSGKDITDTIFTQVHSSLFTSPVGLPLLKFAPP
ncbi:MAG: family 10 glycosylhydrolase [Armatimonadetes bacterium]|nr:family 10 glycosylhydrolase [Armatimonadota bacterium]MDE2207877.1 family 10 glycosylhydrolase [Armatimonadota bacterium]